MFRKILILTVIGVFAAVSISAQTKHKPKTQSVRVNLVERGYKPNSFRLRRNVRAYITFVRKTDATCGHVIVIPAYGIQRDLPLNTPVTITFTPRKSGSFSFTCGMNMLRGKLIVQ